MCQPLLFLVRVGLYRFRFDIPESITNFAGGRREVVVSGQAFLDANANGVLDPNETVLVGFTVSLNDSQTTTDQTGHYAIRVSIPRDQANFNLSLLENDNPDAPSIVPVNRKLELRAGTHLEINLAALPAASLRLNVQFQAQENANQAAPSLRGISVLVTRETTDQNATQAILSSDENGFGLAKGLAPGTYHLRLLAIPNGVEASLTPETIELQAGTEGKIEVILKLPEVEITNDSLSSRIELETSDPLPPGAEPNLRVTIDGDADTVVLIYPDNTEKKLETAGPENFVTNIIIPTFKDANIPALYTVKVRVTRGTQTVTREITIPIDASVPLCVIQLEPVAAKPGDIVKLNLRCLFRPQTAILIGNNLKLELILDRLDPYQFNTEFRVPNDWTGRMQLEITIRSARLAVKLISVLVVR